MTSSTHRIKFLKTAGDAIWHAVRMTTWLLPALIAWFTPYRFARVNAGIGHLGPEMDHLLKSRALGAYPNVRPVPFTKRISNQALIEIWSQHVKVRTNCLTYELIRPFEFFPFLRIDLANVILRVDQPSLYPVIIHQWGDHPPIFQLPDEMLAQGKRALRDMGVPEQAWFVPVQALEDIDGRPHKHRYRNCDIANYSAAVDAIIARGGWCIRMGAKGGTPLAERHGLINYPDTPFRSDWMDLFLCNQARFFLGNTSGLAQVSTISGKPAARANMIPYGCVLGWTPLDISISKLLRFKDGRMPRFAEIFASEISNFYQTWQYEQAGLSLIENTPQQICDLTTEMLDVLDGSPQRTPEDEARQRAFRQLLTPAHYHYHSRARMGTAFLREHAHLL